MQHMHPKDVWKSKVVRTTTRPRPGPAESRGYEGPDRPTPTQRNIDNTVRAGATGDTWMKDAQARDATGPSGGSVSSRFASV